MTEALSSPPPSVCPTGNPCNIKLQEGPQCGTSQEYFPPELLAEQICPWGIAGVIRWEKDHPVESTKNKGRAIAGQQFRLGSLYAELAMAYPAAMAAKGGEASDPEALAAVKQAHLATAQTHLDEAKTKLMHPGGIHAAFLGLYLPMFAFRNFSTLPIEDVDYLQQGLLDIADNARTLSGPNRRDIERRAGIHLLYARQRKLIFPGSAREQGYTGGADQKSQPRNHQAYTFDETGRRKIPHYLITRDGRTDTMGLVFTVFGKLAKEAYDDIAPNTIQEYDEAADAAFDLLYTDANGDALRPDERRVLDRMMNIIDIKRDHYLRRSGH